MNAGEPEELEELDRKKRIQSNQRFNMLVEALNGKAGMAPEHTPDVGDHG